jgi:hypothetical protein
MSDPIQLNKELNRIKVTLNDCWSLFIHNFSKFLDN